MTHGVEKDAPVANGHAWPCPGFYNGNHHPFRAGEWSCTCPLPPAETRGATDAH